VTAADSVHEISVVVPVYQGEKTLEALVGELEPLTRETKSPGGRSFRIAEVVMVHDGARDASADVMTSLATRFPFVRPIWLSRNYGQHPATLAGLASTVSDWVATLDEDGQQDPRDLGVLLDAALDGSAQLVYASPSNAPPHGFLRNTASRTAKWVFVHVLGNHSFGRFNSFRLLEGEIARGVAAYCGESVFLDVALSWVAGAVRQCPVKLRPERGRRSGYSLRRLVGHFWQLVLTSGTRPLRIVSAVGMVAVLGGFGLSAYLIFMRLSAARTPVQGWTSLIVVMSVFSGLILISLGVIAEYVGVAVSMAMGKPPYLIVSHPVGGSTKKAGP
jgi:glycosyltransferase involved in cell wall biosynthesis